MSRVLTLEGPRSLTFREVDDARTLAEGEVRLRSVLSGISHGTEINHYRGGSPFADRVFDPDLRAFLPGQSAPPYPRTLGYEMVSEVLEVAPRVGDVAVGDLVHTGTPHQEATIAKLDDLLAFGYPLAVLPRGADPRPGLFVSLGSVALQAVHDSRINIGDGVAVSGLGVIGLLTVQLAALSGADPIIAVDPVAERRELARSLGATHSLDPSGAPSVGAAVKEANGGRGVDTAIETSGVAAALHGAIGSVALGGRVVTVGFYQGEATGLRLGEEWHHNRPTMVSSMGVWGCPHRDYPAWGRQRLTDMVVRLLYGARLTTAPLISEIVAFREAPAAYQALDRDGAAPLKIGLAYPGSEHLTAATEENLRQEDRGDGVN